MTFGTRSMFWWLTRFISSVTSLFSIILSCCPSTTAVVTCGLAALTWYVFGALQKGQLSLNYIIWIYHLLLLESRWHFAAVVCVANYGFCHVICQLNRCPFIHSHVLIQWIQGTTSVQLQSSSLYCSSCMADRNLMMPYATSLQLRSNCLRKDSRDPADVPPGQFSCSDSPDVKYNQCSAPEFLPVLF